MEGTVSGGVAAASYQIFITPDLAHIIENSSKVAQSMNDEFVSTGHLFLSCLEAPSQAKDILARFKIEKEKVLFLIQEIKQGRMTADGGSQKIKLLLSILVL